MQNLRWRNLESGLTIFAGQRASNPDCGLHFVRGTVLFCQGKQAVKAAIRAAAEFVRGVISAIQEAAEN